MPRQKLIKRIKRLRLRLKIRTLKVHFCDALYFICNDYGVDANDMRKTGDRFYVGAYAVFGGIGKAFTKQHNATTL